MSTNARYLTVVIQLPDDPAESSTFIQGFTDRAGVVGLYAGDALTEIELLEPHVSPARLKQVREEASRTPASASFELAHADDLAVEDFARVMKAKLAAARAKGRGGWADAEPGMQQRLSDMLRAHVVKGDPTDVANFCLFLHQRGESICAPVQSDPSYPCESALAALIEAVDPMLDSGDIIADAHAAAVAVRARNGGTQDASPCPADG